MSELTHLDAAGAARMVDVTAKELTHREAVAVGAVVLSPAALAALSPEGESVKGDVLAAARIAGIMAAKKTAELIPLCHPIRLTAVQLDLEITETGVTIRCLVKTKETTGVEMEALTAVSVAGLTIIDMLKAVDRTAKLTEVRMVAKSGGKSGDWDFG